MAVQTEKARHEWVHIPAEGGETVSINDKSSLVVLEAALISAIADLCKLGDETILDAWRLLSKIQEVMQDGF